MGISEPQCTFSACFGVAFMVWHPLKYAQLLCEKIEKHNSKVWLVNTGWIGGGVNDGKRISLKHTRAIIDAIHDGSLEKSSQTKLDVFNLSMPDNCPNVPSKILNPFSYREKNDDYSTSLNNLAASFKNNFEQFRESDATEIVQYGPE